MPEKESEDESTRLGQMLADKLEVRSIVQDIGPLLETTGCYRHRDDAIRTLVPDSRNTSLSERLRVWFPRA